MPLTSRLRWLSLAVLAAGLWGAGGARAQGGDLRFERLSVENGLPQNFATCIVRDSLGFIWIGTAGGLARYDGYRVDVFQPDPDTPGALRDNVVQDLTVGADGTLWVGTEDSGLARFDAATETFRHISVAPGGITDEPRINDLYQARDGAIWSGTPLGLVRFDPATGRRTHVRDGTTFGVMSMARASRGGFWAAVRRRGLYHVEEGTHRLTRFASPASDESVLQMIEHDGNVWIAAQTGLYTLDPETGTTQRLAAPELRGPVLSLFIERERGWLWVGTQEGIVLVDLGTRRVMAVRSNAPGNPLGLPSAPVLAMFYDKSGIFWVPTGGEGVAFADFRTSPLKLYRQRPGDPASLASSFIRAIATTPRAIWVGPGGQGLNRIDRATGRVTRFPVPRRVAPAPDARNVDPTFWGLDLDRNGDLWGVLPWAVVRHDGQTGAIRRTYPFPDVTYVTTNPAFVHQDRRGRYWVGSRQFSEFDPEAGTFTPVWPDQGGATAIHETRGGVFWVGTGYGLVRYDPDSGARRVFRHDPDDPASLASDDVLAMWAESDRVLWVGGKAGLSRFDTEAGTARRYTTTTSALPDNYVNGVLGDRKGSVWASTNRGLVHLDVETGNGTVIGARRGSQGPEFNRAASHRAADGTLFFGGTNGLNAFDPAMLRENRVPPEVRLRGVTSGGETLVAGPGSLSPGDVLRLRPNQRDLSIEYVGLHYSDAGQNQYQYRLDGAEDWQPVTTLREARYTNLDPGTYTFQVRSENALGAWSDDVTLLTISLPPPWWASAWFRALLLVAGVGAVAGAYRWRTESLRTQERRLRVEVASRTADLSREQARTEQQAEQLQRLNEQQRQLFANVSHETRTPLTLILGPVEHTLATDDLPDGLRRTLDGVRRNGRRLLQLVDRILDLSRLESGQTELSLRPLDLGVFVATLAAAFGEYAERRGLALTHAVPDEPVVGLFDVSLLEHVLFNLLSNATKFTPDGGKVRVSLAAEDDGATAAIRVRDTGIGIPEDQVDRVFDRFSLAHPGQASRTGLGLALVKESVGLHGGTVEVASRPGFGTTFTVRLPLVGAAQGERLSRYVTGDQLPDLDLVEPFAAEPRDPAAEPDPDQTTVLVVEDSSEVRDYVAEVLRPEYRVLEAPDGAAGLALARERLPDLIVSDVMMPTMDGIELCAALKADPALQLVPVVLLTARAEVEDRLAGLGAGADDYLAKPFNALELLARVANLIASRRAWRDQFEPAPLGDAIEDAFPEAPSADDALRQQVDAAIHERFTDSSFSADGLAQAVGLSGSQLRRRMRELYDQTPTQAVRSYRLRQAALQLGKRTGTVAEVAYAVGFNSVSYFTRSFGEEFGQTPTEYADASEASP